MSLGGVHNGANTQKGIQIYPGCGGSLATGTISDVLAGSSSYNSDAFYAVRKALAGGMYPEWNQWMSFDDDVTGSVFSALRLMNHLNLECTQGPSRIGDNWADPDTIMTSRGL